MPSSSSKKKACSERNRFKSRFFSADSNFLQPRCNMKSDTTEWIRNVGIVGHGDTGKTQLVSSLLFTAGMTPRLGKVAEGSTTTDWDEEEIARKISINSGLAFAEWASPG